VGFSSVPRDAALARHFAKRARDVRCVEHYWQFHYTVQYGRYMQFCNRHFCIGNSIFSGFGKKWVGNKPWESLIRKKEVSLYMWSGVGCRKHVKRKCERLIRLHVLFVISVCNGRPFRRTNLFRQFVVCWLCFRRGDSVISKTRQETKLWK